MKKCPFCAESIHDDAIKCRFCGSMVREPQGGAGRCRFCSAPVSSWTRACGHCGGLLKPRRLGPLSRLVLAFVVAAGFLTGMMFVLQEVIVRARASAESSTPKNDAPAAPKPAPASPAVPAIDGGLAPTAPPRAAPPATPEPARPLPRRTTPPSSAG